MQIVPFIVHQLFEFICGSVTYRFTSSSEPITVGLNTYTPSIISVGNIAASAEQAKNGVTIVLDSLNPVAQWYLPTAPPYPVDVIILRYNDEGLGGTDLVWTGTGLGVSWNENDEAELTCEPITVSFGRNALARRFSRRCPYALYDANSCGVNKATYAHTTTVTGITGSAITVASLLSMAYAGGFMEWNNGTHLERRYIEGHIIATLGLMQPFTALTVGATVTVYPGCDRLIATCHSVFNNRLKYGGFPYMRTVNIFKNGFGNYSTVDNYDQAAVGNEDIIAKLQLL